MFRKYAKYKIRLGVDAKRCSDCHGPERPCLADGKPATFHRWVEEDSGILRIEALVKRENIEKMRQDFQEKHIVPPGATLEKLHMVKALVEYPDGSVGRVNPELIQFLDREEV